MNARPIHLCITMGLCTSGSVVAQSVSVGLLGIATTQNEAVGSNRVDGLGGAASIKAEFGKVTIEALGAFTPLTPSEDTTLADFDVTEGQVHIRYALSGLIAAEAGYLRRKVSPELAAQDVGAISVGAYIENSLASVAQMFVRGAFVPVARFIGGGDLGLSFHVGFGVGLGPASARWQVRAEYDFQRFGRSIRGEDVPLQAESARLGMTYRLF